MPTSPSSSSSSSPAPPGASPFSLDEVRRIARLLHEADLSEIEIETLPTPSSENEAQGAPTPRVRLQLRRGTDPTVVRRATPASRVPAKTPTSTNAAQIAEDAEAGEGTWDVLSPTVGVFRAPQPPLQVGDEVKAGQKAGAVEALKIPSDILFTRAGRIQAILAEDNSGVEYAQPLFRLELTTDTR